jgi:hypothetical protein
MEFLNVITFTRHISSFGSFVRNIYFHLRSDTNIPLFKHTISFNKYSKCLMMRVYAYSLAPSMFNDYNPIACKSRQTLLAPSFVKIFTAHTFQSAKTNHNRNSVCYFIAFVFQPHRRFLSLMRIPINLQLTSNIPVKPNIQIQWEQNFDNTPCLKEL